MTTNIYLDGQLVYTRDFVWDGGAAEGGWQFTYSGKFRVGVWGDHYENIPPVEGREEGEAGWFAQYRAEIQPLSADFALRCYDVFETHNDLVNLYPPDGTWRSRHYVFNPAHHGPTTYGITNPPWQTSPWSGYLHDFKNYWGLPDDINGTTRLDIYIITCTHKLLYDTATGKLLRGVNPSQLLLRDD